MMRLKQYLRSSAKAAPLFLSLILSSLSLNGCAPEIEPTYKERDIPYQVKKICKDEYNLEVTTKRTNTTLWIYAPLTKILHSEYGIKENKVFDDEMLDKLRNILGTIGRVLISSDNTPDFFVLSASDINLGLDYFIIANILDIKKSYAGFIPWTEANRRYVTRFKVTPEAIGDQSGRHIATYDIELPDFLAGQMSQRIGAKFQEEGQDKYFKVEKSEGRFINNAFIFEYSIQQISKPDKEIDVQKEILKIIAYCIKTYDFRDFSTVELNDLFANNKVILNKRAVLERTTE